MCFLDKDSPPSRFKPFLIRGIGIDLRENSFIFIVRKINRRYKWKIK